MIMTVHNYRPRQFHRTSNGENPSSGYWDMGSASLSAARPAAPWRQYPSSPKGWGVINQSSPLIFKLSLVIRTNTVYPKKYTHGFCFAVLCCGYTLTDFPISIRLTSLALWQSNDCPSASKATLMNMDKYFMWIHYERLHNHNKAKHNKTVCIFLGIYCMSLICTQQLMPSLRQN